MGPTPRLLIGLLTAVLSCSWTGVAAANQEEWIFRQNSPQFGGHVIYVCHDAIKLVSLRYGFEALERAPDWKVHAFQRKDKIVCVTDKIDLQEILPISRFNKPKGFKVLPGKRNLKGLSCTAYREPNDVTTLTTDIVKTDPKAIQFLCDYYIIPRFTQFPVYNYLGKRNPSAYQKRNWGDLNEFSDIVDTTSYKFITDSWQKVPYNAKDFACPTNYKIVKDQRQILVGSDQKKEIESLLDNIGFSYNEKNDKQKSK
jgi:hypothetical protein